MNEILEKDRSRKTKDFIKRFLISLFVLLTVLIIISCRNSLKHELYNNQVWNEIYENYYNQNNIDIRVYIGHAGISIRGIDAFEIDTCVLYVDNSELELRSYVPNYFTSHYPLQRGESYNIHLMVNDILYESDFVMPYEASINAPIQTFKQSKPYSFSWELPQSYDVQYVGIVLARNDVAEPIYGYVVSEINPTRKSHTYYNLTIPSRQTFKGVNVGGINYLVKDRVLYISQVDNVFMVEEGK